jgi:uncharacterized cupin superfamily protein
MMAKACVHASKVEPRRSTNYPAQFAGIVKGRAKAALGDQFRLTQFGVNYTVLEPGAWSAQRHWHQHEDEFVMVLEGTLTLVNDEGRHILTPGMCAGFKAGVANGHCLVNEASVRAVILEVGTRSPVETVDYPDIDMKAEKSGGAYAMTRKDGSAF